MNTLKLQRANFNHDLVFAGMSGKWLDTVTHRVGLELVDLGALGVFLRITPENQAFKCPLIPMANVAGVLPHDDEVAFSGRAPTPATSKAKKAKAVPAA